MELISEELAEKTWQEVAGFDPEEANKEMMRISKSQPYLMAFMIEFSQDLDEDVKGLAIYMFAVVYRMFKKSARKRLKRISVEQIIECYDSNEKLMENLDGAHERFFDRIARVQLSRQPYVMKYVVDTLMETPEDEEPVPITEDDVGYLFLLLKSVVDALDLNAINETTS